MLKLLAAVAGISLAAARLAGAAEFYVSPTGNDAAAGTKAAPFATIEHARDAVRADRTAHGAKPATVWIAAGTYRLEKSLEFTAADAGSAQAPLLFRAVKDGAATLDAARHFSAHDFQPVTNPAALARIAESAKGHVVELDLAAQHIAHGRKFPDVFEDGGGLLELYCGGERQPLARWPNKGEAVMASVLDRGEMRKGSETRGGSFAFKDERPKKWQRAAEAGQLWLAGFWRVPWEFESVRVQTLDAAASHITLATAVNGGIGNKYAGPEGSGAEPWHAINLLEELDSPGEWCVDFPAQKLYFWPPVDLAKADISIADLAAPLIHMTDAAHITLRGLVIEGGLENGVTINGGEACALAGCTVRRVGGHGVFINGGKAHRVSSCDLYTLGRGGIILGGGDRQTLTAAGHIADNNHVHHYALTKKIWSPGIGVGYEFGPPAVGCIVTHNLIHDSPHSGILYGGNDNLFEFNELHHYLLESDDLGAFYTARDWLSYGNTVRHNFVHDAPGAVGVYMDDGDSGDLIESNLFVRLSTGVAIGGGHDNIVRANIFVDCKRGATIDARGISRHYESDRGLLKSFAAIDVTRAPWIGRFPGVANLRENHPELPRGCVIENNVGTGAGEVVHLHAKPAELSTAVIRENVALPISDLGFANPAALDFRMNPAAPVFKKVPGIAPFPFEKVGLYVNELRPAVAPRAPSE